MNDDAKSEFSSSSSSSFIKKLTISPISKTASLHRLTLLKKSSSLFDSSESLM
jgi:hypothetical protein